MHSSPKLARVRAEAEEQATTTTDEQRVLDLVRQLTDGDPDKAFGLLLGAVAADSLAKAIIRARDAGSEQYMVDHLNHYLEPHGWRLYRVIK